MPMLQPVEHDPFAPVTVPVDHDPFDENDPFTLAAARVRAPYARANARVSGLPDIGTVLGNKLASVVSAPYEALHGTLQVTDPETGMPTREAMERGQGVAGMAMTGGVPFAQRGAAGMAGGKLTQPALKVADDGTRINIAPHDMQVPEWGKGLSWGLTAYRTKIKGEDAIHVRDARLPPEMQGQGHGTAMYEHAADLAAREGKPLLSDGTVTQDAANRWMALNRAGYNVQMAPDKIFRPGPPEAPQLGRFETPDGSPVFRVETSGPQMSVEPPGITAYHGSPHDFDRFDIGKIGTGEGAQAYGHGLYFAESEPTAQYYKDALTTRANPTYNFQGRVVDHPDLLRRLQDNFSITGFAARRLLSDIDRGAPLEEMQAIGHSRGIKDAAKWLHENGAQANPVGPGRMYQVSIKAPPEHFLDWDKPLSEQSEHVKDVLRKRGMNVDEYHGVSHPEDLRINEPGYAAQLREAGIPGIKYLDQGSRGSGKGTHNYVVFSHDIVDILKKYGLAGVAALPAAGAYHYRTQSVDHDPFAQ